MSSQTTEIRHCVHQALEELADVMLFAKGFRREQTSLVYSRVFKEAKQKIQVDIEHHPSDRRDAAAAVYPCLTVSIDRVNKFVQELVQGDEALGGPFDITLWAPIDWTSLKKASMARWFIFQADSIPPVIREMSDFLTKWTIPFLDRYATAQDICDDYDRGGEKVQMKAIRVVAAMLLCGRPADALTVMNRYYGRKGTRKEYRHVFEYVEAAQAKDK